MHADPSENSRTHWVKFSKNFLPQSYTNTDLFHTGRVNETELVELVSNVSTHSHGIGY
jgi:hypothetical protein